MIDGSPPWYYSLYLGTIWSIIIFSIIIAGFIVFFVMRFRQRKNKATILFERLGLAVALFCLLGYLLYLLLLML